MSKFLLMGLGLTRRAATRPSLQWATYGRSEGFRDRCSWRAAPVEPAFRGAGASTHRGCPISVADQREAAHCSSLARSQHPHRTDRSRMPEKTHKESCRAAASLFFWAERLASNSAGGKHYVTLPADRRLTLC